MKDKKKDIITSLLLLLVAVIYTILVKCIDIKAIGPNNSLVGFSTINEFVFNLIGVHMILYHLTDWLGFIPIITAITYAIIGLIQIVKRKNLLKVDKEIIGLGVFYLLLIGIYVFFEKFIINYRPILINGFLEASYPSSHTLIAVCISTSSLMVNKKLYRNSKIFKFENIVSIISMIFIVVGRMISGVHWFSDIIGALLISFSLLKAFNIFLNHLNKNF